MTRDIRRCRHGRRLFDTAADTLLFRVSALTPDMRVMSHAMLMAMEFLPWRMLLCCLRQLHWSMLTLHAVVTLFRCAMLCQPLRYAMLFQLDAFAIRADVSSAPCVDMLLMPCFSRAPR